MGYVGRYVCNRIVVKVPDAVEAVKKQCVEVEQLSAEMCLSVCGAFLSLGVAILARVPDSDQNTSFRTPRLNVEFSLCIVFHLVFALTDAR